MILSFNLIETKEQVIFMVKLWVFAVIFYMLTVEINPIYVAHWETLLSPSEWQSDLWNGGVFVTALEAAKYP